MVLYSGWLIPEEERERLLRMFPTKYRDVYAQHITLQYDVPEDEPLPTLTRAKIVGISDDYYSIEALVVSIGGSIVRPDGSTFHCTWSLDKKLKEPKDSNELIRNIGYNKFLKPTMINVIPAIMGSSDD